MLEGHDYSPKYSEARDFAKSVQPLDTDADSEAVPDNIVDVSRDTTLSETRRSKEQKESYDQSDEIMSRDS